MSAQDTHIGYGSPVWFPHPDTGLAVKGTVCGHMSGAVMVLYNHNVYLADPGTVSEEEPSGVWVDPCGNLWDDELDAALDEAIEAGTLRR